MFLEIESGDLVVERAGEEWGILFMPGFQATFTLLPRHDNLLLPDGCPITQSLFPIHIQEIRKFLGFLCMDLFLLIHLN